MQMEKLEYLYCTDEPMEYLYYTSDSFEFREMTPEMKLCFSIFGGAFRTKVWVIERISEIIESVMQLLTPQERETLIREYGIGCETMDKCGDCVDMNDTFLSIEKRKTILDRALRSCRADSSVRNWLRGQPKEFVFRNGYSNFAYIERIQDIIKKEFQNVLEGKESHDVYISRILSRNQITITVEKQDCVLIETLGLSSRSYNLLKKAGIYSLNDLIEKLDGDSEYLMKIKNFGRKSAEEVIQKCQEYLPLITFTTIEVLRGKEKTVYKFMTDDMEKIAESLYINELLLKDSQPTIIQSEFSPGVVDILLMQGYFYQADVFNDVGILVKRMNALGFSDYAREITLIAEYYNPQDQYKELANAEDILVFPDDVVKLVRESGCTDFNSMKVFLETNVYYPD